MSGFLAIFDRSGEPVAESALEPLAGALDYRGPHGRGWASVGSAGLVQTVLDTGARPLAAAVPQRLGGSWVVADARLDERDALLARLAGTPQPGSDGPSDGELILRAYREWGDQCLEHLHGDFAFALWDGVERRLFCARDRFGVRPLFYAESGGLVIVANCLATVRRHPAVSDRLDDAAIADLLLFDHYVEPTATAFRQVRRVPPAHLLVAGCESVQTRRYWRLETADLIRYRDPGEYLEQFEEVFGRAVGDRLGGPAAAVTLSGGIDSTVVAVTARRIVEEGRWRGSLAAFTSGFRHMVPDREGELAAATAAQLGMPAHFVASDADDLYPDWQAPIYRSPEPSNPIGLVRARRLQQALAEHGRLALSGFGGDPLTLGSSRYYLDRLRRLELGWLARDLAQTVAMGRRPPLVLRTLWRRRRRRRWLIAGFPPWIQPELEERLELRSRWRQVMSAVDVGYSAHRETAAPHWSLLFEAFDQAATRQPLEHNHPFFDLRVVNYLLRVPPLPWHINKLLLRRVLAGRVPESVRTRPKAVFEISPFDAVLRGKNSGWWREMLDQVPAIRNFVAVDTLLEAARQHADSGVFSFDRLTRSLGLAIWLWHEDRKDIEV